MRLFVILLVILHGQCSAKLLDKIVGVIDDQVVTKSLLERYRTNWEARKNIAPMIYREDPSNPEVIINTFFQAKIIRDHLEKQGIVINDDHVESEIKSKEKQLGLGRKDILAFLKRNNVSFEEYFQISREVIEYQQFLRRTIYPLISVSEQEVRNQYYEMNKNNKTVTFKLDLIDFYLPEGQLETADVKKLPEELKDFQVRGILPEKLKNIQQSEISDVDASGLSSTIQKAVSAVGEGEFSPTVKFNGMVHVFYVKKRSVSESEDFIEKKRILTAQIQEKKEHAVQNLWVKREQENHYTKKFL